MRSFFHIFHILFLGFVSSLRNSCLSPWYIDFLLYFLLETLRILAPTLKSCVPFCIIFMYVVKQWLRLSFFLNWCPVVRAKILSNDFSFPHWIPLETLPKIDYICLYLFLYTLFCSMVVYVYSHANTTLFWLFYCSYNSWKQII